MGDQTDVVIENIPGTRIIGDILKDGWIVGPVSPETGKETDFLFIPRKVTWDKAMHIAGLMHEKDNRVRPVTDDYAQAMKKEVMAEDSRGGEKPMTEIMLKREFWSNAVIEGSPELGRIHFDWPYTTDVEPKDAPAYIVVIRDAEITPP
jgi:hypothetical protein